MEKSQRWVWVDKRTVLEVNRIMEDPTEGIRRLESALINAAPGSREALEKEYGQVWDTEQLLADFEVLGFMAPYVVVKRKADGRKGSLSFQHLPRFYFEWKKSAN